MESEVGPGRQVTGQCRVAVQFDGTQADLALPGDIAVGQLIPAIYDILNWPEGCRPDSSPAGAPFCLHLPGQPALDPSMTLSQLRIGEGSLLILAPAVSRTAPPPVVYAADAVAHISDPPPAEWTSQQSRLAALLVVIAMAGITGLMAVPDGFGAPNVLLGAASAATAAAVSTRVTCCGQTTLMALTTLGTLVTTAALGATLCAAPLPVAGMALTVLAVGVLTVPHRLAVIMSGLSRYIRGGLDPDSDGVDPSLWDRSRRAQRLLTALIAGASVGAALGTAAVAFGSGRRWPDCAAVAVTAALLILRSNAQPDPGQRAALLGSGILCTTVGFAGSWWEDPQLTLWLCAAAAVLALGALWFGFDPPAAAAAPPVRRCLDVVEYLLLASLIPLFCWSSGLYGLARGLSL